MAPQIRWRLPSVLGLLALVLWLGGLAAPAGRSGEKPRRPVVVKIEDNKQVVVEAALPIDPTPRLKYTANGLSVQVRDDQNRTLHLSHFPILNINGQAQQIGQNGGQFTTVNAPLPKTSTGRERRGFMSVFVQNDLRITMTAELVPTKAAKQAQKRRLDSVLLRYTIENTGKQSIKFGLKAYMDTYIINNDGALFAAPTMPGKVLDGIELKDKTLPDYVQILERPNLKDPGFVAHLTLNLGSGVEKASRIVLSRHGAGGFGAWDMPAMQAMGDSALGIFFEPKDLKPGGKRDIAYAYGEGIATGPESEGRVTVQLGGSFEPGKLFTVAAVVHDPIPGQTLTLDLPAGMERVEGREIQPVPTPGANQPHSLVYWKARVRELGRFPIRIRSSTGVTQTKMVSISRPE